MAVFRRLFKDVITKCCNDCGEIKSTSEFSKDCSKKDGLRLVCKDCDCKKIAKWRIKNPEKVMAGSQEYYANNTAACIANAERWANNNTDRKRELDRLRARRNRKNKPEHRLVCATRTRINSAIHHNSKKDGPTTELMGCSWDQFFGHIEINFLPGMTWENYGEWHVDHIRPCASFDLTDPAQQRQCFNWKNLQPLWAKDNLKKGAKLLDA